MSNQLSTAILDFEMLYNAIIAPTLQITTDLSAKRGDKLAYNDIAAMLALYAIVNELAQYAAGELELTTAWPELTGQTPGYASCAMILQHAELSPTEATQCLEAIETGYLQLCNNQVIGAHRVLLADTWQIIETSFPNAKNEFDSNLAQESVATILHDAAVQIITSIDIYEKTTEHRIQ